MFDKIQYRYLFNSLFFFFGIYLMCGVVMCVIYSD